MDFSATDKRAQAFAMAAIDEPIMHVVSDDSVVDRAEIDLGAVERLDRCMVREIRLDLVRREKARGN